MVAARWMMLPCLDVSYIPIKILTFINNFFLFYFSTRSQDDATRQRFAVDLHRDEMLHTTKTTSCPLPSPLPKSWRKKVTSWGSQAINIYQACPSTNQRHQTINKHMWDQQPLVQLLDLLPVPRRHTSHHLHLHLRPSQDRFLRDQFTNLSQRRSDQFSMHQHHLSSQLDVLLPWIAQAFNTAQPLAPSQNHL